MNPIRTASGVVALVLCISAILPARAQDDGENGNANNNGPSVNGIMLTNVNVAYNGHAIVSGIYTTAMGVDISSVKVIGFPTNGGPVVPFAVATTNKTNKQWSMDFDDLRNQNYTFYALGTFSDTSTLYSNFGTGQVTSNKVQSNKLASLSWSTNFPGTKAKTITGQGVYVPATDGTNTTFQVGTAATMTVFRGSTGGTFDPATMTSAVTIDAPAAGGWQAVDIGNLQAATTYTVIVVANGSDGNTYCAPVVTATTPP